MIIFLWAAALILMLVSGFYAYRFSHGLSQKNDFLSRFQRWTFCTLIVVCAGAAVCVVLFNPWGAV